MSDSPSTLQWLLGGGGLFGLGAGCKWLIEWWGKRHDRAQERADRLAGVESAKVATLTQRIDEIEEKMTRLTIAVNVLIAKEFRTDPNSPELLQVRAILGEAFPIHLGGLPKDMQDSIDGLK